MEVVFMCFFITFYRLSCYNQVVTICKIVFFYDFILLCFTFLFLSNYLVAIRIQVKLLYFYSGNKNNKA